MDGEQQPQHSIGVVARRTDLSPHVLRAWERRYSVVQPGRGGAGARLYSDADVLRLRLLRQATAAGRSISQVAGLSTSELLDLVQADEAALPESVDAGGEEMRVSAEEFLEAAFAAIERLDGVTANATLMRAVITLNVDEFVDALMLPLLRKVGDAWAEGRLRPTHEHVLSVSVRRVLGWLLDSVPMPAQAPTLLVSTLPGQQHEFGAMLAAVVAGAEGWRVIYLGADLPVGDIAAAATATRAAAVAVGAVGPMPGKGLLREVRSLRDLLSPATTLFVGGAATEPSKDVLASAGAVLVPDFATLRRELQAMHTTGARQMASLTPSDRGFSADER